MYNEVFERMRTITQSGWLPIYDDLIVEKHYISEDGTYVAVGHNANLSFIRNNTIIYEYNDINLVKYVRLKVGEIDSDIKLSVVTGGGESKLIHAKNREVVDGSVNYLFEIQDIPLIISIDCPENKKYSLIKINISGDSISKLRDIIIAAGEAYDRIKGNEDEVTKELSKDVVVLNSKKEELEEETKSLIETNKRLHETKEVEESQIKQTREMIESLRSDLSNLNSEIKINLDSISKQSKEIRENESKINSFITEISEKEEQVETLNEKVKKYKEEESRFSEDFSSYKEEVRNQNRIYIGLLLLFISLTAVISFVIYKGALSTVDNFQFNFDLWTHLVSRLPIIFINVFLLGALTSVIYFLINIITENSNNIAKTKQVSYLVKECVDSQKNGLDELDEDDILKQRVESKMELIKSLIVYRKEDVNQKIDKAGIREIVTDLFNKNSSFKSD
ncbi:TPA: coiled-coil domain-containing protein [Vibrio alginolyticus]